MVFVFQQCNGELKHFKTNLVFGLVLLFGCFFIFWSCYLRPFRAVYCYFFFGGGLLKQTQVGMVWELRVNLWDHVVHGFC